MCALKIGWGKREISTSDPVSIPGQMHIRVSEGIHDPLYATALCVDGGEDVVIFCTADVVVLRGGVIRICLLYTSPSPRDSTSSRMPSSA